MKMMSLRLWLAVVVFATGGISGSAGEKEQPRQWVQAGGLAAPEARQAAAADGSFVYAIDNRVIARYDRSTGKRLAVSSGAAHHLNSGLILQGKLYAAHSNFPAKPEKSEIKVLDLQTMKLTDFKSFGESPHGSLTVVLWHESAWWCVFARYGAENHQTVLVQFDSDWNEQGVWTFPESVISDLGKASISGGVWRGEELLMTGHDKPVLYRLQLPQEGRTLLHKATVPSPFPGQGIADDPQTGGLVGIDRKERRVIFAQPE